jgi:hypothetical protein
MIKQHTLRRLTDDGGQERVSDPALLDEYPGLVLILSRMPGGFRYRLSRLSAERQRRGWIKVTDTNPGGLGMGTNSAGNPEEVGEDVHQVFSCLQVMEVDELREWCCGVDKVVDCCFC